MTGKARLAPAGVLLLASGAVVLSVGAAADLAIVALWGQFILGITLLAYPLSLRNLIRLRTGALESRAGTPTGPGGGIIAGAGFDLPITLTNRARAGFGSVQFTLVCGSGISLVDALPTLAVGRGRRTTLTARMHAARVGPAVIHGVHLTVLGVFGLYQVRVYEPLDIHFKVLPRTASPRSRTPSLSTRAVADAVSSAIQPIRGLGSDIRELRDHLPGDPFKHIAWKASARSRRLVVKEFESEVSLSVYVLLDIGPTMRWGPLGETRLDHGIDLAFHLVRTMNAAKNRVGLVTFDREVYGVTRAATGHHLPQQVIAHLLEVNAVVHEDFTDLDRQDLVGRVATFIKAQEGLDLSTPAMYGVDAEPWDTERVITLARDYLADRPAEMKRLAQHFPQASTNDDYAAIRQYCRLRGLDLPYRKEIISGAQEQGIARALEKTVHDRGGPHTYVVVTDLLGVTDAAELAPVVRLARAHRHRLVFSCPPVQALSMPPTGEEDDELSTRLRWAMSTDLIARRERVAMALRAQGVSVYTRGSRLEPIPRRRTG